MTTYTMDGGFIIQWASLNEADWRVRTSYELALFATEPTARFYRDQLLPQDVDFPYDPNLGDMFATLSDANGKSNYTWDSITIQTVSWANDTKTTTMLYGTNATRLQAFYVPLFGDPLPAPATDAAVSVFLESRGFTRTELSVDLEDFLADVTENDVFAGTGASDVFDFGSGDDTAKSNGGADSLAGGEGQDWLNAGGGDDTLSGGGGNDTLKGGNGEDSLDGGYGDDRLFGGNSHDRIDGGAGDDRLVGGKGRDTLEGGAGADTLIGGDGADVLTDGSGNSVMFGQAGHDTFYLMDWDKADDFVHGGGGIDRAHISLYDIDTVTLEDTTFRIVHGDGSVDTFVDIEVFVVTGFDFTMQELYDGILATL